MPPELWTAGASSPARVAAAAKRAEDEGWDGFALVDSQNLAPDPYVLLALAAATTSRLGLATGVTNPLTRHPATAATAAASVQLASGGRFVLGIGRGDSALAHLGLAPASPQAFDRYLARLQGYLAGREVPFETELDGSGSAGPAAGLGMAGGPEGSRIRWVAGALEAGQLAKVPVDVAATGPKVIEIAARRADRVTFAVGASVARLRWAIDRYCDAGGAHAGVGAYVPVLVHPQRGSARRLIAGGVASFARFSVMHGSVAGPASDRTRTVLEQVHDRYDMNHHFSDGSPQSQGIPDEVIDEFGIAGPAGYCIERLQELVELGLSKIVVMGGGIGMSREAHIASRRALAEEVLPALSS